MTTDILYKKVGRKYIPVGVNNDILLRYLPVGAHLVVCNENGTSYINNIDPARAPLIAAAIVAEDAIAKVIVEATDLRPSSTPVTKEQQEAWNALSKAFGESRHLLEWPSPREAAQAAVDSLLKESDKLMKNESVRKAYDHFLLMCKLSAEEKK